MYRSHQDLLNSIKEQEKLIKKATYLVAFFMNNCLNL